MIRRAVLIEASNAIGQQEIAGCKRDVARMNTWLQTLAGGAWNPDEIKIVPNPSKTDILSAKTWASLADFAFVTFSGHGHIEEDSFGERTQKIVIGTGDKISLGELKPAVAKTIIVCDACREVHRLAESAFFTKSADIERNQLRAAKAYTRQDYRDRYERLIQLASNGWYTMYSCSPDECAGEDVLNGGVFTAALLNRSASWYEASRQTDTLFVDSAFKLTKSRVEASNPDQHPTGGPSIRLGLNFPFAINLR